MPVNTRPVEPYVLALAVLGGLLATLAVGIATRPGAGWTPLVLGLAVLLAGGYFVLQRRGFVLHWRGQRVISTIDEAVVYLALVLLPWGSAPLVVFAAAIAVQIVAKRAPVKGLFNVACYTIATSAASLVFLGASTFATTAIAAIFGVATYTLSTNLLVSGIFARTEGLPFSTAFRQRFLLATGLHSVMGASFGFATYILSMYSPLAVLVLAPMAFFAMGFSRLDAGAEREVLVRRRLAQLDARFVTVRDEEAVVEAVLEACADMFVAGSASITLDERTWKKDFEGGARATGGIECSIVGRNEVELGHITIWPSSRVKQTLGDADRPLLAIVAGRTATAIQQARAMGELTDLKELHEGIVQHVPAGILRLDAEGRILQTNSYLLRALRQPLTLARGLPLAEWAPLRDAAPLLEAAQGALKGEPFFDVEVAPVADGAPTLEATGVPYEDAHGHRGAIILFSDVTAHRHAASAVRSQMLTRPFVRRLVLSLTGSLDVPPASIAAVGRSLATELGMRNVEDLVEAFRALGLGNLRLDAREGANYSFSADDLLEKRGRSSQPTCHLALGFLEGAVAAAHGSAALGTELKCQSKGHPRCVFAVQPRAHEEKARPGPHRRPAPQPSPRTD